jgi:DNA-directed RNA polymerase specialized sigma54-like protein
MKMKLLGGAAALAALVMSGAAGADDDKVSYAELTNCAAFVLLEAQVYDSDSGTAEDKAKAETYYQHAASLTYAAALLNDKDPKAVTEDVKKLNTTMIDSLSQDGAAEKLIKDNAELCNALGQAAHEALNDKK